MTANACPLCQSDELFSEGRVLDEHDAEVCEVGRCASCGALLLYAAGVVRAVTLAEVARLLQGARAAVERGARA